jgi:hypothetical protein
MGDIFDLSGKKLNKQSPMNKPINKTQAGAILISEIDIAIKRWNDHNLELVKAQGLPEEAADCYKSEFMKYEYAESIKESQNLFGYAELNLAHVKNGIATKIYTKAVNFAKENELNNTNAYFPHLAIDCMGFLLASGLMYNLAFIVNNPNQTKAPENATETKTKTTRKPKADRADSTGTGNTIKPDKKRS